MKTAIILFSILLLTNTALKNYSSIATYYVNKTYYADVLCENKEDLTLDCEGSCQLNMKILELNNIDQAEANIISIEFQNLLFVRSADVIEFNSDFTFIERNKIHSFEKEYTYLSLPKKDKPPIFFL